MIHNVNEVSISIYAKVGGLAYFSLKANGDAIGSHSSADKTPFIHEAKDILSKEIVEVIFQQATKVLLQKLDENSIKKSNTSEIITITDFDGVIHYFSKNYEQSTVNAELEILINLLKKYSIGW